MSGIFIILALVVGLAVGIGIWLNRREKEPTERSGIRPEAPTHGSESRESRDSRDSRGDRPAR